MNSVIKTNILVDNPLNSYVPYSNIRRNFSEGNYFSVIMGLACTVESMLRKLALKKSSLIKREPRCLVWEKEEFDKIPLNVLIKWIGGEKIKSINHIHLELSDYPEEFKTPIITNEEKTVLIQLKDIRNDISHNYCLIYDNNLRKELIGEMIEKVRPIYEKINEEMIRLGPR